MRKYEASIAKRKGIRPPRGYTKSAAVCRAWLTARRQEGYAPHEIAVFVRSEAEMTRAQDAVHRAGLSGNLLDERSGRVSDSVVVGTMHRAKGLEFRAVAVAACDDEVLPLQSRIENVADEADLEDTYSTERHLLYMACTRARDNPAPARPPLAAAGLVRSRPRDLGPMPHDRENDTAIGTIVGTHASNLRMLHWNPHHIQIENVAQGNGIPDVAVSAFDHAAGTRWHEPMESGARSASLAHELPPFIATASTVFSAEGTATRRRARQRGGP